ncbi:MAG: hypothetical protein K5905_17710 [Roseibium sp.]|uniref:hypothetical protein n=1 Tax=Roseibium sp. TaxID=1936156 RepID=UPI00261775E8|nr:hypothetical protein [Roseibium sp.]MCV0427301.1 hypothetical protein [Roseibium sp.]
MTKNLSIIGNVNVAEIAISIVAAGYWAAFWAMNGLDKFLNRSDIGPFNWYGKDRVDQFTTYFLRLEISPDSINSVLCFAGVWELFVAIPLLVAIVAMVWRPGSTTARSTLYWSYFLSGITLIGFSVFDVVAGDRAELREHGLYFALLMACCLWARFSLSPKENLPLSSTAGN